MLFRSMSAKTGDILIFVAAKAVRGPDGKLLGGVAVCPKWNVFTKNFIDPLRFGARGYGLMLDGKGHVIAHATDKDMLLKSVADQPFAKEALARKTGARGLRSILEHALIDTTFDLPNASNVEKVVVDESTIEDGKAPLLVYREAAKKA